MNLVEETSVPTAALPIAELKAHLRLGSGFADDDLQDGVLESFLRAAMAAVEGRTGKILIERSLTCGVEAWRDAGEQRLPVAPVSAIESVTLVDRLGVEAQVAPSAYRLVPDSMRPSLRPVGNQLPSIPVGGGPISVSLPAMARNGAIARPISARRCSCWHRITTNTATRRPWRVAVCPLA